MVGARRRAVALGVVGVVLWGASGCDRGLDEADLPAAEEESGLIVFPSPREIRIPPLLSHQEGAFGAEALRGKWSFVFFGFTSCPDICPTTMATLRDAEAELDDARFQGVLVSVDPKRDRPDVLRAYLEGFSPRFLGVTGEEGPLREFGLELAAGFTKTPPPEGAPAGRYLVDHSGHVAIVDPDGRFAAILKAPRRRENVVEAFRRLVGQA